jgi:hypothetical protein
VGGPSSPPQWVAGEAWGRGGRRLRKGRPAVEEGEAAVEEAQGGRGGRRWRGETRGGMGLGWVQWETRRARVGIGT